MKLPTRGKRIQLRRLSPKDLPDFQAYRQDPEVGRYQGWSPESDDTVAKFLVEMESVQLFQTGKWCQIGIAELENGQLIGDIGICLGGAGSETELGFSLRKSSQGQGLATEALNLCMDSLLQYHRVTRFRAITDSRNSPAIQLLERLGMTRTEAVETTFKGEPCVDLVYQLHKV